VQQNGAALAAAAAAAKTNTKLGFAHAWHTSSNLKITFPFLSLSLFLSLYHPAFNSASFLSGLPLGYFGRNVSSRIKYTHLERRKLKLDPKKKLFFAFVDPVSSSLFPPTTNSFSLTSFPCLSRNT
jgi:hypothetical protein